MNLVIDNPDNLDLDIFCEVLIKSMQNYLASEIDEDQLIRFDAFLNNNNIINYVDKSNRLLSTKAILIGSSYNLIVVKNKTNYTIQLDTNVNIPNTYAPINFLASAC